MVIILIQPRLLPSFACDMIPDEELVQEAAEGCAIGAAADRVIPIGRGEASPGPVKDKIIEIAQR